MGISFTAGTKQVIFFRVNNFFDYNTSIQSITVYPNPTPDKINIGKTSLEDGETAKVYLSDDQGKVLLIREQTSKMGTLELGNFKAGIYYI